MPSTHPLACPISLDAPVCPQITRCGHIFSFPSLMQFLIYAGGSELRKAAPCPLCFTNIAARELRTAQVQLVDQVEVSGRSLDGIGRWAAQLPARPPKSRPHRSLAARSRQVGATLDFRLLRRPKGSSIPELANVVRPDSGGAPADAHSFAKVSPVSDPTELWAEQAAKLAQFAAQVGAASCGALAVVQSSQSASQVCGCAVLPPRQSLALAGLPGRRARRCVRGLRGVRRYRCAGGARESLARAPPACHFGGSESKPARESAFRRRSWQKGGRSHPRGAPPWVHIFYVHHSRASN